MPKPTGLEALAYELAQERAQSLGRVARKMEAALQALREFDEQPRRGAAARASLLAEAGELVWFYVVQREALGWHDHDEALTLYAVPGEVRACMGPRRPADGVSSAR